MSGNAILRSPWGSLSTWMGYAPAYTKSVEKGTFLQKGFIFHCKSHLGILYQNETSSLLFKAEKGIGKQHFENVCKIVKKTWYMSFDLI